MSGSRAVLEIEDLRQRLQEAEETLAAIRSGKVDAVVVSGPDGDQVFALKGAEQPYRIFLETMYEGAATLFANGTIAFSNGRLAEMLAVPLEEVSGKDLAEFVAPNHRPWLRSLLERAASGSVKGETALRARSGAEVWAELALTPAKFDGEDGFCLVANDITERRRAEEAVREWNVRLERRVAERTAELTAANRELEAFSYSVSHDLRAPLRAMSGFSQKLLEDYAGKLDPEARRLLDRVHCASQRMDELVEGLLILSRTTRLDMRRTTVDMTALAAEIATELRRADPARQVEFVIASGMLARADRDLLQVVLENLLGNAWKYTGKHPRARIEIGTVQQNGETVYFVRDDGAGFDMAYGAKLFGVFERLHGQNEFEGTGIGLATVQRIVQRHGGRVWAEAAVEQGATFFFTLPAAPATP